VNPAGFTVEALMSAEVAASEGATALAQVRREL